MSELRLVSVGKNFKGIPLKARFHGIILLSVFSILFSITFSLVPVSALITAVVTTVPQTEAPPDATIEVTVVDLEEQWRFPTGLKLSSVVTVNSGDRLRDTAPSLNSLSSSNPNTGTFFFRITVRLLQNPGDLDTNDDIVHVEAFDAVHIFYVDSEDANGNILVIERIINIRTESGRISFDQTAYNVGESMSVTVEDFDANRDSTIPDSINLVVTSDSYGQGQSVTLTETSASSARFTRNIEIVPSNDIPSAGENKIPARIGETITFQYQDQLGDSGNPQTVVMTRSVAGSNFAAPSVTSIDPPTVDLGQTIEIFINGNSFLNGATVSVSPPSGISLSSLVRQSQTRLRAMISVSGSASLGGRDITVINPDGQVDTLQNGIEITEAFTFSISASFPTLEVLQGDPAANDITVTHLSGDASAVTMGIRGLPSGATYVFVPDMMTPTDTSRLTIDTSPTTPPIRILLS